MTARRRRVFERAIARDPYDPDRRRAYARWLAGQGLRAEARQQRWLAWAAEGKRLDAHLLVLTRRGVTARPRCWGCRPDWTYWRGVAERLFREFPDSQFVVVSPLGLRWYRFRVDATSPVVFYRTARHGNRVLVRRVVRA
jgi:hypothetical protein